MQLFSTSTILEVSKECTIRLFQFAANNTMAFYITTLQKNSQAGFLLYKADHKLVRLLLLYRSNLVTSTATSISCLYDDNNIIMYTPNVDFISDK
jgi:hypothetical protein